MTPTLFLSTILALALGSALALPADTARSAVHTESDLLDAIYTDCLRKDSLSCLKLKLFSFVDKALGHKDTITLTDGVQLVKSGEGEPEGAPRALTGDETIEGLLMARVQAFFESHTIKVDLKGADIVNAVASGARSFNDAVETLAEEEADEENKVGEEARKKGGGGGGKKGQKMMGPLLAAAALKAAVLGKLALAAIALIAGKALLIGKIALVLSAIIGLKKLLGGNGKHVTYEVVSHPQHSTSHVSSHESVIGGSGGGYGGGDTASYGSSGAGHGGGWGRSLEAQQLAYRGHEQATGATGGQ